MSEMLPVFCTNTYEIFGTESYNNLSIILTDYMLQSRNIILMIKKSNHLKPILVSDLSEINYCVIVLFSFFLFVVHGQTVGKHSLNCGNITNNKKPTIRVRSFCALVVKRPILRKVVTLDT